MDRTYLVAVLATTAGSTTALGALARDVAGVTAAVAGLGAHVAATGVAARRRTVTAWAIEVSQNEDDLIMKIMMEARAGAWSNFDLLM